MKSTRRRMIMCTVGCVAAATGLVAATPAVGAPVAPRADLVDPCMPFTDPDFAYSPEQVAALIGKDYASLRQEIAACQGKALTELKKPKMKKPKVPKIPGMPPTFWVYVTGSQAEMWSWSLPLEPDPVMCTSAISGQRFTVVSPVPAGATLSNTVGNAVGVTVKAGVVDTGWGQGSDCDPTNWAGIVDGIVSFDFSTEGIRLQTYISRDRDLSWEYGNDSGDAFVRKFSKTDRAALLNPRKGILTYTLTRSDAGDAVTDSGSCMGWGDEGTCTYANSWGLKITLVRAEPMDLVNGP